MKTFEERRKCCPRCFYGTLIYIAVFIILLFVVVFGVIPVVFKYSVGIQRSLIFPIWMTPDDNFTNFEEFNITGVKNFYINVDNNITLGAWHILPELLLSEFIDNDDYNFDGILEDPKYNIVLYLHGNGGVRSVPLEMYDVLRRYFQIIAVDYRGYADSTPAILTEDNIVGDIVNVFKWLRNRTKARIFIWGHSLGTGVGTHTVANLNSDNYTVSGLVLEAPFSTITDVMEQHPILKMYSWLPWYKSCFINPIIDNGFAFESTKHIINVDCPIMILHAKDDEIIPYDLATKLYEVAISQRNLTIQGNVTYHLFGDWGYRHMGLYYAPELPEYTRIFVEQCLEFENSSKVGNL